MTTTASTAAVSTASAPVANARALGLAHYAARGVLEYVLAQHGTTFQQQIALRAATTGEAPQTSGDLVDQVRGSLKADPGSIRDTLDELLAKELLVEDGAYLRPTDAAHELLAAIGADSGPISARIWGGIPEEDLIAAGRVLTLITERADAELAALTA